MAARSRRKRTKTRARVRALGAGAAVLFVALLIIVAAAAAHQGTLIAFARTPRTARAAGDGSDVVSVVVPVGANADDIARILAKKGVIGDARLFQRWVRFVAKKQNAMKAGQYELSPSMSPEQILALLTAGKQPEVQVTIPEGLRKEDVAALLAQAGLSTTEELLAAMNDRKTIAAFGVPANVPGGVDGYLFPDTYRFHKNAPPERILRRMRERLDDVVDDAFAHRMRALGWTLHETLTLAAIVEKETAVASERPRISAVFHNRLARGMKLQTDPTVIYGIPRSTYDGNIRRADLQRAHPYNTYVIHGLPPGPIAQPGREAIRAALWPAESDDVFFVARGDSGAHEFCPTLDCHNAAVQKWQVDFWAQRKRGDR
jgi:UPF0755 protein